MAKSKRTTKVLSNPSPYDGCYVKVVNNPTFWAVDDGHRRAITKQDLTRNLLRKVVVISTDEMERLPIFEPLDDQEPEGHGEPPETL